MMNTHVRDNFLASGLPTKKTDADQVANSTTQVTVNGLQYAVAANTDYTFEYVIPFQGNTLTCGLALSILVTTATTTYFSFSAGIPVAANGVAAFFHGTAQTSGGLITGTDLPAINTVYVARLWGAISVSGTGGTIDLRFRPELGTGETVTVKKGASGVLWGA
jgi:hypothetical protein